MSTLKADTIVATDGTSPVTLTKQSAAKAWLNYDGSTNTVEYSFNVTSVTDNSTGNFTVIYVNNMSNNTPVVNVSTTDTSFVGISGKSEVTASQTRFEVDNSASQNRDRDFNSLVTHGDLA